MTTFEELWSREPIKVNEAAARTIYDAARSEGRREGQEAMRERVAERVINWTDLATKGDLAEMLDRIRALEAE